jgi:hypothetical protein
VFAGDGELRIGDLERIACRVRMMLAHSLQRRVVASAKCLDPFFGLLLVLLEIGTSAECTGWHTNLLSKRGVRPNQAERSFVVSIVWVGTALSEDWRRPSRSPQRRRSRSFKASRALGFSRDPGLELLVKTRAASTDA